VFLPRFAMKNDYQCQRTTKVNML